MTSGCGKRRFLYIFTMVSKNWHIKYNSYFSVRSIRLKANIQVRMSQLSKDALIITTLD